MGGSSSKDAALSLVGQTKSLGGSRFVSSSAADVPCGLRLLTPSSCACPVPSCWPGALGARASPPVCLWMLHTLVSVTGWPLDSITAPLLLIMQRIRKISQLQQGSGLSVLSTALWYLLGGGTALLCLFTVHNFANGLTEAQLLLLCKPLSVGDICADRIIFFLLLLFLPLYLQWCL